MNESLRGLRDRAVLAPEVDLVTGLGEHALCVARGEAVAGVDAADGGHGRILGRPGDLGGAPGLVDARHRGLEGEAAPECPVPEGPEFPVAQASPPCPVPPARRPRASPRASPTPPHPP